jgi:hypothetical protein
MERNSLLLIRYKATNKMQSNKIDLGASSSSLDCIELRNLETLIVIQLVRKFTDLYAT